MRKSRTLHAFAMPARKMLVVLLAVLIAFNAVLVGMPERSALTAHAEEFSEAPGIAETGSEVTYTYGELKYVVLSGCAVIVGCDPSASGVVTVPGEIDGFAVVSIGDKAFENCSLITEIVLPESIVSIGNCAFWGCENLDAINIPDGLQTVGVDAYAGCGEVEITNRSEDGLCAVIVAPEIGAVNPPAVNTFSFNSYTVNSVQGNGASDPITFANPALNAAADYPDELFDTLADGLLSFVDQTVIYDYNIYLDQMDEVMGIFQREYCLEYAAAGITTYISYYYKDTGLVYSVVYEYSSSNPAEEFDERYVNLTEVVFQILEDIEGMTDYEKVLYTHDWLVLNGEYDTTYERYNGYDILVDGIGVCQAYAYAFEIIMTLSGIPSMRPISDPMNHTWNIVYIDGEWYQLDITWDDPVPDTPGRVRYTNFILTDAELEGTDHYDWVIEHECTDDTFSDTPRGTNATQYYWNGRWYLYDEATSSIVSCDIYGGDRQTVVSPATGGVAVYNNILYYGNGDTIMSVGLEKGKTNSNVYKLTDAEKSNNGHDYFPVLIDTIFIDENGILTYMYEVHEYAFSEGGNDYYSPVALEGDNSVDVSDYDDRVRASSVVLDRTSVTLEVDDIDVLTVTVTPDNCTDRVKWESSDENIVYVYEGEIYGVNPGLATITVTVGSVTARCFVNVIAAPEIVNSISLDKTTAALRVGESVTLTATISPSGSNAEVVWETSDDTVATVSGGKVTAVGPGTATITASAGSVSATCVVTVKSPAVAIKLDKTTAALKVGESVTLTATVTPANTTDIVVWESSNTSVATVVDGKITAVAPGKATITATAGSAAAICSVTVTAPATAITLSKTEVELKKGAYVTLTATLTPANSTDSVTWESSDTSVATVSGGKITAVAPGTATITATAGSVSATCTVTVIAPATAIKLDKTSATVKEGESITLTATVTPSYSTDTVTWKSSDTSVATVADGKVTAVAPGKATITATAGSYSATCTVTVVAPATAIGLDKTSADLKVGDSVTLTATVTPANSTDSVVWKSSSTSVVTVSGGKVTAVGPGTATITATAGSVSATCTVTVTAPATAIKLDKTSASVKVGAYITLTATVTPSNSTDAVTWKSSDTSVATVAAGKVTGVAPGTATITVTAGSVSAVCTVTVTAPATAVSLDKTSATIEVGESVTLIATVTPANTTDTLTWKSSDTSVATVVNGEVTAVGPGKATITATAGSVSASCTVNVTSSASSITLSKTEVELKKGAYITLTATLVPADSTDVVVWESSDTSVATVSNGKITAVAPGTAIITATVGSVSASCTVTVIAPATAVKLNKTSAALKVGEEITLTATVTPSYSTDSVVWQSSDESVATVADGKVVAVAPGKVTITATAGAKSAVCTVTITAPATAISLDKTAVDLKVGETATLTATLTPSYSTDTVTWKTSNRYVATVSGGKITAIAPGKVTITATAGGVSATCTVTITAPATAVTLSKTEATIKVGAYVTLTAKLTPSNSTDSVVWESSDTSIATVVNGKVVAVAPGSATITATAGSVSAECAVTVTVPATSVKLDKTTAAIIVGEELTLTATAAPDNTTDSVVWTSSNNAVATVADGRVTALAPGKVTITAKAGAVKATCVVTITAPATSISLSQTEVVLKKGAYLTLTATVTPSYTTDSVVWKSSDTSVAKIYRGKITAVAPGTATITATAGGVSATCTVTVVIPATAITVSKTAADLKVGEEITLTSKVTPSNSTDPVVWESSDNAVATVVDGKITAVAPGTATITATAGAKSAACVVTVTAPATDISLDKTTASVNVGEDVILTATVTPANSTDAVVWESSDEAIATVADGKVTAVAPGTVTITATAGSVSANCTVTVNSPATAITLNKTSVALRVGQRITLIATVTPADSTDSVVWESSDETIATVVNGKVTAVADGSATITATAGSVSATCDLVISASDIGDYIDYDVTPNINGGASKLYEPWGLRYYAVYTGEDIDLIADRGIAILKDTNYFEGMTPEEFCDHEKVHIFLDSMDELGFEDPTESNPGGRYYATLTDGIYSYDISSYYYVVPFAVMENGQTVYGTIKKNSMENILNSNLSNSGISAAEKKVCSCILDLKDSVAAHYAASGVPGASIDMEIPRGSSQTAATSLSTPAQSGITPNIVAGASRLIEPWGLRYFAVYTESGDIADRGMVILSEKYYSASYADSPDDMRLNANSYVFRQSDNTLRYDSEAERYYGTVTDGITSKDIADVYHVVPYVVLNDGSYVYGTVKSNSMMKIMNANLNSTSVPATEKAVMRDIIALYEAVKAYYEA